MKHKPCEDVYEVVIRDFRATQTSVTDQNSLKRHMQAEMVNTLYLKWSGKSPLQS